MSFSLKETFSEKNRNMLVGLISLLMALWLIMFVVPDLFVSLFDTTLGNLILIVFIILASMHSVPMGLGLAVVFVILFRFSHMSYHF